jgi:Mg2+ and Co2+ transporter CorA
MISRIFGSDPIQALMDKQPLIQCKSSKTSSVASVEKSDKVSISTEAYAALNSNGTENTSSSSKTEGNNLLSLADDLMDRMVYMVNNIEEITKEYKAELKRELKAQGVDMDTEFKLSTGSDGSVYVVGDHPDKAKIEQYFKDNPEMRDRFVEIEVHTKLKKAIELHMEFVKEYEKDPEAAVAKYFPMFEMMRNETFTMGMGGEGEASAQAA